MERPHFQNSKYFQVLKAAPPSRANASALCIVTPRSRQPPVLPCVILSERSHSATSGFAGLRARLRRSSMLRYLRHLLSGPMLLPSALSCRRPDRHRCFLSQKRYSTDLRLLHRNTYGSAPRSTSPLPEPEAPLRKNIGFPTSRCFP